MSSVYESRRTGLYDRLPDKIRTVVVTPGPTLRYLTGYRYPQNAHGNTSPFVLVLSEDNPPAFIAPELEAERARSAIGEDARVGTYTGDRRAAESAFADLGLECGTDGSVAVEYGSMRLLERDVLAAGGVDDLIDVTDLMYDVRSRKDEREIALLRQAAAITDEILTDAIARIEPDVTESQVASTLARSASESDADGLGVSVVVSGPRTAQIHTDTTDRAIEAGDLVLIDTGVVYQGYYTDVTRTVAVGDVSTEHRKIHETVRDALESALDAATPGVSCGELDAIARDRIVEAGYGEHFVTTLGHGFGLEPHEPPSLEPGSDIPVEVGHAFTVEPGIYVEEIGGVRIEDDVVMTEDGPEVLTDVPYTFEG